jgi:cytosine/creatinine deaminase
MHSMDNYYVSKLLPLMAEAELHAIANPLINICIQGRHDTYPKRRGLTRIPQMLEIGINVAFGMDCVMDPWYSLGTANPLDAAHMAVHVAQMTSIDAMNQCFASVTTGAAAAMQLPGYGIAVGHPADMVMLDARDPVEAIRLRPPRLAVIKSGRVIATSRPRQSTLALVGRPIELAPAAFAPKHGAA